MKPVVFIFFIATQFSFGQDIYLKLLDKTPLQAEKYLGTDNYGNRYYIKDNVFYKSTSKKTYQFSDLQLGKPTSADIINPLKIMLFYKSTNTVVFLDRHLVEIDRARFNALPHFKNLKFVTAAGNNALWLFNLDSRQLEIHDYIRKKTLATSQPVSPEVLDQKSNFNFCWLLTETTLEKYNIYGSLLEKIPHEGLVKISENNGRLIVQKRNELFFKKKASTDFEALDLPEMEIKAFHLNDENLYLYDGEILYRYGIEGD
jgi:hypothetical protein